MKKISKSITNKKFLKKSDNLFSKNTISLDNPKNRKYLDYIGYQEYLKKLKKEVVIFMKNDNIIIIYQEVGKSPTLKKVKSDICSFENLLKRRNTNYSL